MDSPEQALERLPDRKKGQLGWLAAQLEKRDAELFYLEDLTGDWLPSNSSKFWARWAPRIMVASALIPSFGLVAAGGFGYLMTSVEDLDIAHNPHSESPNAGTRRQLWRALRRVLIGVSAVAALWPLWLFLVERMTEGAWIWIVMKVPSFLWAGAVLLAIDGGGSFVFRHYAVRIALWKTDLAPLRFVRFLEQCADLGLLKRVGGSYQFFHKEFRAYVARRYGSEWLPTDQTNQSDPTEGGVHS